MRPSLTVLSLLFLLAACGNDAPPASASTSVAMPQEAETRIGDVTVHASVAQTSALDASVATQYGLERSDRLAMLLVSVRRTDGSPAPAGVVIEATAIPSQGARQPVTLRELRVGELVDRVGTVEIAPPESLRFELSIRYGNATSTMDFSRDFYPR